MKFILQVDGGGILGTTPARVLAELEQKLGKPLNEVFDYMYGTSTGAIITGCLAAGVPAQTIHDFYIKDGKRLFTKKTSWNPLNWFATKYDKKPFYDTIKSLVGDTKLSETRTDLTVTAFNSTSGRTHYLNTKSIYDKDIKLVDAIAYSSLSAAYYFGKYNVPDYKWTQVTHEGTQLPKVGAVFNDGGQGVNNCTLNDVMALILGKHSREKVYVLSLGTGNEDMYHSFKTCSDDGFFKQIISYPFQAREEATYDQVANFRFVAENNPYILFKRIDYTIPKKANKLDNTDDINYFNLTGLTLFANKFTEFDIKLLSKKLT